MRNYSFIISWVTFLACGVISCKQRTPYYRILLELEDSVHHSSQYAINTLKKMDTSLFSAKEKALYHFLLVKNTLPFDSIYPSDSILAPSISYYTQHQDCLRLSKLYSLQGDIYLKSKYWIRATDNYSIAKAYAGENKKMLFDINMEMSRIYRIKKREKEEKDCLNNALKLATELQDSLFISEALYYLATLHITQEEYEKGKQNLMRALTILPQQERKKLPDYYDKISQIYMSTAQFDSALYYINMAIALSPSENGNKRNYKISKGNIYLQQNRFDSAEYYFAQNIDLATLDQKVSMSYMMARLKKETGHIKESNNYLEKYLIYRDSLDLRDEDNAIEEMKSLQEYKQQKNRAMQLENTLFKRSIIFYRVITFFLVVVFTLVFVLYSLKQRKKKLEGYLQIKKMRIMEFQAEKWNMEMYLLKEKEKRAEVEVNKLQQTIEYYKRLNELTIPLLMKRKNVQGAMHLSQEEWDVIVKNTNACFNNFTIRLKNAYPQLSEEEVYFCCLVKMQLSMDQLSEIYHIAKGSISRRKMRLKEKIDIKDMSFDDFINAF